VPGRTMRFESGWEEATATGLLPGRVLDSGVATVCGSGESAAPGVGDGETAMEMPGLPGTGAGALSAAEASRAAAPVTTAGVDAPPLPVGAEAAADACCLTRSDFLPFRRLRAGFWDTGAGATLGVDVSPGR